VERSLPVPPGRILALDFGKRRIGLAVTDPLRLIVTGLDTLQRTTLRADLDQLAELAADREVSQILIGLPLNMNGTEGLQAERVREFAAKLGRRTGIPVELWDERLTSVAAEDILRERGLHPDRRSGTVDRLAASILLQGYLDHHSPASQGEPAWPESE
jgi:putative Holliday junction resolvase